jgi:integrase
MRWSEVDFEKRLIIVAHSWNGPPKNGEERPVPILDVLLPVLKEWKLQASSPFVFPNSEGGMFVPCARQFQETLHDVLERAGFPRIERHGKLRWYVRFHDLRHTFASHWMLNGGELFKLQQVLGHASPQMTMRYAHFAPAAFASDYARLGPALATEPAKIIPLVSAAEPC